MSSSNSSSHSGSGQHHRHHHHRSSGKGRSSGFLLKLFKKLFLPLLLIVLIAGAWSYFKDYDPILDAYSPEARFVLAALEAGDNQQLEVMEKSFATTALARKISQSRPDMGALLHRTLLSEEPLATADLTQVIFLSQYEKVPSGILERAHVKRSEQGASIVSFVREYQQLPIPEGEGALVNLSNQEALQKTLESCVNIMDHAEWNTLREFCNRTAAVDISEWLLPLGSHFQQWGRPVKRQWLVNSEVFVSPPGLEEELFYRVQNRIHCQKKAETLTALETFYLLRNPQENTWTVYYIVLEKETQVE